MHFVVRTQGDPARLAPSIEAAVHTIDAEVPLSNIVTAADWYADSIAQRRFQTLVLLLFAGAAIVLAATGIYGVMHDSVSRRRREIGIRVAVGADAGKVLRMVLGEGLVLTAAGLALGLGGAVALSGVLASFLYEVSPTDPLILGATDGRFARHRHGRHRHSGAAGDARRPGGDPARLSGRAFGAVPGGHEAAARKRVSA